MQNEIILWFQQVGKDDITLAGGKGANLGELTQAGIDVPPGFIVSASAYHGFLDAHGLRAQIGALLAPVDVANMQALQMVSQEIKQVIGAIALPDAVVQAVHEAYGRLGGGPVAVRSSATAEDLPQASFAGQQSTFLNVVGGERVAHAVKECWASLFEAQAIFYRAQGGFDHLSCGIAVPVQSMVQSERSGVMFTVNPITNDTGQIVIEGAFGLGEAVVSGLVTPDMYIVDKASLAIVERAVSEQERELVRDPSGANMEGTVWRDVPVAQRNEQKLTDAQVVELARLGLRVEQHYGRPQDIEWAIEGGQTYLLQARPVTTL
jgi:pyruvate,water dikinase